MGEHPDLRRPRVEGLSYEHALGAARSLGLDQAVARMPFYRVLLVRPEIAKAVREVLSTLLRRGTLPPRLRELLIMRVGWTTASEFEWSQHWHLALDAGVSPEELAAVREWRYAGCFTPAERAALQACDEMTATGTVTDVTWAALAADHQDEDLIEIVTVVSVWQAISTLLRTLEIPLDPGVEGWPPDGASPPEGPVR